MNEYKSLVHEDWVNIDLHEEDIFKWDIALIVLNPESLYYGGYLRASISFPKNYPYSPPGMFSFPRSPARICTTQTLTEGRIPVPPPPLSPQHLPRRETMHLDPARSRRR